MEKYRHLKRGTEYEVVLDDVELQCSKYIVEGNSLTIYRSLKDGKLWARPFDEFHDKDRFEKIAEKKK